MLLRGGDVRQGAERFALQERQLRTMQPIRRAAINVSPFPPPPPIPPPPPLLLLLLLKTSKVFLSPFTC